MARLWLAFRFVAMCIVSLGAAVPAQAQASLDGYWDLRIPNALDGTHRDVYLRLQQKGEVVSGGIVRRPHELPLTGTYQNGNLHLVTVPPTPPPPAPGAPPRPAPRPMTYDGVFADGKLNLHMQGRNGVVEAVAERTTEEANRAAQAAAFTRVA